MTKLEDFDDHPTIMWLFQELDIIRVLMAMPKDYLRKNAQKLRDLVGELGYSHMENVGFIRPKNEGQFLRFGEWVDHTWKEFEMAYGENFSSAFKVTFDDVAEEYPGWREEARDRDIDCAMMMATIRDLCSAHEVLYPVTKNELYEKEKEGEVPPERLVGLVIEQLGSYTSDEEEEVQEILDRLGSTVASMRTTAIAEMTKNCIKVTLSQMGEERTRLERFLPDALRK